MKFFIVNIHYKVDFEKIKEFVQLHRSHLDDGYKIDMILMSGPFNPKTGGVVICKADDIEKIKSFFKLDPYYLNNLADYTFQEFEPVKYHPIVEKWINS
jgi:uncharacterized protein YciI